MSPALASTTRLDFESQTFRFHSVVKERGPGLNAWSTSNLLTVCAQSFRVVGLGGLEPPASPLSGVRSNHLSYRPNVSIQDGGACRDRTDDPLLAKQVLSQLS